MSVQPPPSGRPTGPPSGPLSGPSQTGPTPPPPTVSSPPPGGGDHDGPHGSGGSGGSGGGDDSGGSGASGGGPGGPGSGSGAAPGSGPGRPWWRSVPRIAAVATALVAAVVLVVVLTRPDGGSEAGGEVFLQAAGDSGPDPFTESTARESDPGPATTGPSVTPSASRTGTQVTRGVDGAAPGLYGGTRKVASCDVEQQVEVLQASPDKNRAFASVQDIEPSAVPGYLRGLTPVTLRMDTRVTNHGYRDGEANAYQAVLQAGTAVLVDDRGVPRVRCACGNPLLPPVAQEETPRQTGKAWPGYRASDVVVVEPSEKPVKEFVMVDPENGDWFERPAGDTGDGDRKTDPPKDASASPCPPGSGDDGDRPCPSPTGATPPEPSPDGTTSRPGDDPATSAPPPDDPATSEPPPDDPATEPAPEDPPGSPDSQSAPQQPAPDSPGTAPAPGSPETVGQP
ncbi:DUF6777 domain-containing protein [Streptomyces sp. NPDC048142]|uniref:DUF6777 domain-containing protein n=1 Tax=Streptomyces sp. NPDC048142 TaxID=3365501 RepID=UPI00371E83F6